jgi:hypothetical protein
VFTIRRMGYRRPVNGMIVGGVWTFLAINAACLGSVAGTFVKDFNYTQEITQRIPLPDIETLSIADVPSSNGRVHINFGNLRVAENYLVNDDIRLRIVKSDDGKFELVINNDFLIQKGQKWRNQHVNMTLKVPVGKKIRYNREMRTLFGFDLQQDDDADEDQRQKCYDSPVRLWVMTENGFKCAL